MPLSAHIKNLVSSICREGILTKKHHTVIRYKLKQNNNENNKFIHNIERIITHVATKLLMERMEKKIVMEIHLQVAIIILEAVR